MPSAPLPRRASCHAAPAAWATRLSGWLLLGASLSACGDEECISHDDCATGESCIDRTCIVRELGPLDVTGRFPTEVPEGFELIDLGEIEVLGGETPDLSFEADDSVHSFFVFGVARPGGFVVPLSVRAPDGSDYVVAESTSTDPRVDDYFAGFAGPGTSPNRVVGRPRAAAAMIPNTPRLSMMPGVWTFRMGLVDAVEGLSEFGFTRLGIPIDSTMRVGVLLRRVAPPTDGLVDLVLTFDASSGLSAASAQSDADVQRALELVDVAFGDVGVRVGQVEYRDLAARAPQPLDLQGPSCLGGELPALFDALPPAGRAVQLAFIGRFQCVNLQGTDIGPLLAALSNGVPGIPFVERDGIVIATSAKADYPEDWALVIAHELGHYFGLTHTVEGPLEVYDNIADTSEESPLDYLMYPNVSLSGSTLVTPDQGEIVRMHPAVYAR